MAARMPYITRKGPSDEESEDGEGGEITTSDIKPKIELPPDILELQPCNEEGREMTVCGAIRLPRGGSLGPFIGEPVEPSDLNKEDKQTIIEFTDHHGQPVFLKMGDNGRWLSLIKKKDKHTANCLVYYDGDKVWCEIKRDVLIHSELTAVFTVDNPEVNSPRPDSPLCVDDTDMPDIRVGVSTDSVSPLSSPRKSPPVPRPEQTSPVHPLIYPCPFCAVRFSSPRTLDAHVQFYCSKKPPDLVMTTDCHLPSSHFSPTGFREGSRPGKVSARSSAQEKCGASEDERSMDSGRSVGSSPVSSERELADRQNNKDLLKCQSCPYSCWSISSLTRHKNKIHGVQSQKKNEEQFPTVSPSDMFCYDCNIQFSSMSTYRGHKDYYCPKRLTESEPSSSLSPNQRSANMKHSPQHSPESVMLASPTFRTKAMSSKDNQMYSGIVVPTQFLSPSIPISMGNQPTVLLAAPILASGGLANIAMPAIIMQPVVSNRETSPGTNQKTVSSSEKSPLREMSPEMKQEETKEQADLPLDLSTKNSSRSSGDKEKTDSTKGKKTEDAHLEETVRDLSISSRRSQGERPSAEKSVNQLRAEGSSPTGDRPESGSCKPGCRADSEMAPSPKSDLTEGKSLIAPSQFLVYDHLAPSYVHGQLIPNPAFLYGRMQNDMIHGDSRLNATSPHVSKCLDCNIVFFKHENFLIHKKHYCASRKRSPEDRRYDGYGSVSVQDGDIHTSGAGSRLSPRKNETEYRTGMKAKVPDNYGPKAVTESRQTPIALTKNGCTPQLLYFCNACSIKFSSADTLQAHKEFYCSEIKSKVVQENSVRVSRVDPRDVTSPQDEVEKKPGVFSCTDCNNSYPSARLLKLHFCNTNTSKTSLFRCLYCDFVAQTENKYVDHMKAHAPSKVYRCALCGYRGNTIRGMRMHGKMHVDQGSEFTDEHMLEFEEPPQIPATHVSGTGVGPIDVEAELIRMKNEPYKRRRSRKSYEKSEYSPSPKKHGRHVCPICYAVYPDSGTLSDHMQMHISSSKYTCRACDFTTDHKSVLIEHMQSQHDNSSGRRETPSTDTDTSTVKTENSEEEKTSQKQTSPRKFSGNSQRDSSSDFHTSSPTSSPVSPPALKKISSSKSPTVESVENGFGEHAEKENVPLPISSCVSALTRQPGDHYDDTSIQQDTDKLGPKYCKSCDINFTFLSSFLAHKRYYCSGVCPRERDTDTLANTSLTRQQH
ncbi:zinc finger protein ush-like isoform X2 [Liolophura sinensis]|uniref:zinc finger protein ush-like isoform X2 n=1 Tax=Liolophura sinensis TaxID=3198878 RepID=UPI0031598D0B